MPHRDQRNPLGGGIEFQTGYDSKLEPRPVTLNFCSAQNRRLVATTHWSIEDADAMAHGLLKFIEIARNRRRAAVKELEQRLADTSNVPDEKLI